MGEDNIKNLEHLIQSYTGPSKKVLKTEVARLTAPGENYIGLVLRVDALLKDESTGKEEEFHAVAKCCKTDAKDFLKEMIGALYLKECSFYTEIVPTLQRFLQEEGIQDNFDLFAKLYASRRNAHGNSDEVDEDSVLLLENLKVKGYDNADRTIGFDLEGAKLILRDLARFHAIPLAFKLKRPEEFETKIKNHLARLAPPKNVQETGPPKGGPIVLLFELLKDYEDAKPYLEQVENLVADLPKKFEEYFKRIPVEPFATIQHSDLWTNNTMQIFKDGKPVANKIVDFQFYFYESPINDLIFFLWSSVQLDVLHKHFDNLLKHYHGYLLQTLIKLGCDPDPFVYNRFLKELDRVAPNETFHLLFMLPTIFAKKGESAFDASTGGPDNMKKEAITQAALKRAVQFIKEFNKRGWLK